MGTYRDLEKRRNYFRGNKKHIALVKANQERVRAETQIKLWKYLTGKKCQDCPETDPIVLDFDHIRGTKRQSISKMIGHVSWSTLLQEIDKCEIRCANCHRRRHAELTNNWRWSKYQESNLNLDTNLV
jgi:hypothetical protein